MKFPGYWSCDNQETSPDTASGEAEPPTVENHWSRRTRTCAPMDGNQSPWRLRFHGPPSLRFLDPWALSGALRACTFNSSSMGSGGLRPTEQPPGAATAAPLAPKALGGLLLLPSPRPSRPIANDAESVTTPPCACLLPGHFLGLPLFGEHSFGYPLFLQQRKRETQKIKTQEKRQPHFCIQN